MSFRPTTDPLEALVRHAVRVSKRLREEGVLLRFHMYFDPCEPTKKGKRRASRAGDAL